ncbi:hypothetical protein GGX14DRAFT_404406 [Mycena pura]|uniref:Uncharacterized protein n=1 Tax=Mycena pura TaxID=153505 RepID=A0AAD6UVZ0_9AGAR|nr:hypothetical protein GGX14DRAFT_404406 [Mycena pura]
MGGYEPATACPSAAHRCPMQAMMAMGGYGPNPDFARLAHEPYRFETDMYTRLRTRCTTGWQTSSAAAPSTIREESQTGHQTQLFRGAQAGSICCRRLKRTGVKRQRVKDARAREKHVQRFVRIPLMTSGGRRTSLATYSHKPGSETNKEIREFRVLLPTYSYNFLYIEPSLSRLALSKILAGTADHVAQTGRGHEKPNLGQIPESETGHFRTASHFGACLTM